MTLAFILFILSLLTTILLTSLSPLSIVLLLFTLAASVALLLYFLSAWSRLVIFIIYIGGVIIIFSYFVAVTPNQTVSFTPYYIYPSARILMGALLFNINESSLWSLLQLSQSPISSILNSPSTLIFLGVILLIILIVVAKVSTRSQGALRPYSLRSS